METHTSQRHNVTVQTLTEALEYFKCVTSKLSLRGNSVLLKHLATLETVGLQHGIPADGIDILLRLTLSGTLGDSVTTRILKCLLPAAEILPDTIITAVSLFCTGKCSSSTQSLFLRWLISVFDLIPCKDVLATFYNFFFCFLQDDRLCPSLCHLLYLLTKREHVRYYRVRTLLDFQSKQGFQPHILGLLSIYKVFCPELVSLTLPRRVKMYFKSSSLLFTSELRAISKRNAGNPVADSRLCLEKGNNPTIKSRKRKWNSQTHLPVCRPQRWDNESHKISECVVSNNPAVPVEKLQTLSQLLENILHIELPAQMGCVLTNPLLLNYISCIKEDDSLLRLNYWLAFTLHEECGWYTGKKYIKAEVETFLSVVVNTQEFLQEGLSGSEEFLHKCLPCWNGCYSSQILCLISWIPLVSFPDIEVLLFETLTPLFVSSSLYFKLDVLKSLKKLLLNWLVKHSVYTEHNSESKNDTMSGLMTSVDSLIQFTGQLCTLGLQLHNSPLFLHFVLDFYKLVCDVYLQFSLPLIVFPPPAVFYSALLCTDCINLNQLCYIMNRYRDNLMVAKRNEQQKIGHIPLNISSRTFILYNQYLTAMVGSLWTSQAFHLDSHPQGIKMDQELIDKAGVPTFKKSFNIVFHPALMGFSSSFLRERFSEEQMFQLNTLKGKYWDTYLDFLYNKGICNLKLFIDISVNRLKDK